ncbi:MAG: response regulator [Bacteroidota bacterium]
MYKLLFSIFIYPMAVLGHGQTDSLFLKLAEGKINENERVDIYLALTRTYLDQDLDSAFIYARAAHQLSRVESYISGVAGSSQALGNCYLRSGDFDSASYYYRTTLRLNENLADEPAIMDGYYNLGNVYYNFSRFDSAKFYYQRYLEKALKTEDAELIGAGYTILSNISVFTGEYEKGLKYYNDCLPFLDQCSDQVKAEANYAIGLLYWDLGKFDLAITSLLGTAELLNQPSQRFFLSLTYEGLGDLYNEIRDFQTSRAYYEKALALAHDLGVTKSVASIQLSLAQLYTNLQNYDSAENLYLSAKAVILDYDFPELETYLYQSLGVFQYQKAEYEKAASLFQKSLEKQKETGLSSLTTIECTHYLGKIELAKANLKTAQKYFLSANQQALEINALDHIADSYKSLAEVMESLGNYPQTVKYLKLHRQYSDSSLDKQKQNSIIAEEAKFQALQKEKEIAVNRLQLDRQKEMLKRRSTERNILIVGIVSALLIALSVFFILRNRLKTKELIHRKQEEIEQTRTRFFTNISHEIRTPLTIIDGITSDFMEKAQTPATEGFVTIKRNSNRLLTLVNQILDLSKLDVGQLKLKIQKADIVKPLKIIVHSFDTLAESKKIRFKKNFISGEFICYFDLDKVEKIVYNLLSNAFKFTQEDGEVAFSIKKKDDFIVLQVNDTGNGIPSHEIAHIFDRFHQLENDKDGLGTGVGLAITKELTELHQGHITVQSNVGAGSQFSVSLCVDKKTLMDHGAAETKKPLSSVQPPVLQKFEEEELPLIKGSKSLVLVIEDNADLRDYIKSSLEEEYQVTTASDGSQGKEKALECIPDVVVSDVMMPGMNGIELCSMLKSSDETSHIPIILLTAKAAIDDKLEGLTMGADDYLVKPFDKRELRARIKNLLTQRDNIRRKFDSSFSLDHPELFTSTDQKFLKKLKSFIEAHLDNSELSVEEIAAEMHLSRVQLYRKIKALCNMSVSKFVRNVRLQHAAELLKSRSAGISEIAYQVGFSDVSYFTKTFKERYQKTPSEVAKS